MLVRAMVISAGTPGGAYQADVLRSYLECAVPHVARSAFDRWFDEPREQCMEALAQRALAYARAQQVDLSGPLCGVQDWYIVDSTTVTVRDALREELPGTGDYAAIKVASKSSPSAARGARAATIAARPGSTTVGNPPPIDESWRGDGLLADLGYASLARPPGSATRDGGRFAIVSIINWKPKIDYVARGESPGCTFFPGTDFRRPLPVPDILRLDGWAMDADVHVGKGKAALHLRLVGV